MRITRCKPATFTSVDANAKVVCSSSVRGGIGSTSGSSTAGSGSSASSFFLSFFAGALSAFFASFPVGIGSEGGGGGRSTSRTLESTASSHEPSSARAHRGATAFQSGRNPLNCASTASKACRVRGMSSNRMPGESADAYRILNRTSSARSLSSSSTPSCRRLRISRASERRSHTSRDSRSEAVMSPSRADKHSFTTLLSETYSSPNSSARARAAADLPLYFGPHSTTNAFGDTSLGRSGCGGGCTISERRWVRSARTPP
mmetsp:Transcript_11978/g.37287  ORF Transcript_11978/g.37287 Transcript_11978/m.37287 type:complete len:260 (+) Transcript_11978:2647-3426(+)